MPDRPSQHYDVIIVGAGPAGLACARPFVSSSLSCLVIEQQPSSPDKACAGGLTYLADRLQLPPDRTCRFKNNFYYLNNKYHDIPLLHTIRTIDRADLANIQREHLQSADNIHFLFNTRVLKIQGDAVLTKEKTLTYRYLIGADGANSIVRKHLGLKNRMFMGMTTKVKNRSSRLIWHLDYKKLYSGYIWEFPHKTHTSVGIFFSPRQLRAAQAESMLKAYIREQKFESLQADISRGVINGHYQGCVFGNIFLVGEAAGLVSNLTGEGISFALISGADIAKKILDKDYALTDLRQALKYKKRQDCFWAISYYLPFLRPAAYPLFIALMKKKWFQNFYGL